MTMHTLAAHEPTRAEALAASGGTTPPTTKAGPLPAPADRSPPSRTLAHGPELAELLRQLEHLAERVGHLLEDVAVEAPITTASASDVRGALVELAGAELRVRMAAERIGAVLTLDAAAPEPAPASKPSQPRPRRKGGRSAASAALEDARDATDSDPVAEAEADAAFGRGWRAAD